MDWCIEGDAEFCETPHGLASILQCAAVVYNDTKEEYVVSGYQLKESGHEIH